jgi:hypothetical protein
MPENPSTTQSSKSWRSNLTYRLQTSSCLPACVRSGEQKNGARKTSSNGIKFQNKELPPTIAEF